MSKKTHVKIPGYRVMKTRGEGAMATVYEAEHKRLKKTVALKVLHDFVAEDPDYRERFLREARAAAKLNHRNVVRAYEAGEHEGAFYFAMEYVEGEDLGERLLREGCLDEEEALRIGIEITLALAAAEDHGMVHRDIKPENVLLGEDGAVKLADLGLAKVQGDGHLTAEGYTLGTVAFFSPEQCRGSKGLDIRSDLYALGTLLYNLVSGELPFGSGKNPVLTMQRILEEEPPPLQGTSSVLVEAIALLMQKDKAGRPPTACHAQALLEGTLEALGSESTSRGGSARKTRRRRRARAPVGGAADGVPTAAVALMAGLGIAVSLVVALRGGQSGRSERPSADALPTTPTKPNKAAAPRELASPNKAARPSQVTVPTASAALDPLSTPSEPRPGDEPPAKPKGPTGKSPAGNAPGEALRVTLDTPSTEDPTAALDLQRTFHAESVERSTDTETRAQVVRIAYDWSGTDELQDWRFEGSQVTTDRGGLLFKVPARGAGSFVLDARLRLPVEVSFSVRVTTRGIGRQGVLWTTLGPAEGQGLASFGGATLYALEKGSARYLDGRKRPQTLFAGRRKRVRLRFTRDRVQGWLDGKQHYDHSSVKLTDPLELGFRLERGVAIDLRHLVVQGRLDPDWAREASGS